MVDNPETREQHTEDQAVTSDIEREREALLGQLREQARLLENQQPALAILFNEKLRELVGWLVANSTQRKGTRR